jgi:glycosyltransferase involved in cell wall biosynthesis
MRVTAYVHLSRTKNPTTGVGKHIINMTRGLSVINGVDLSVLASRQELDAQGQIPSISRLSGIPAHSFPLSLRLMEQLWRRFNFPAADRWAPGTDWIYSPAEAFVATAKAKLAVTVHDVAAFEPDLPWSKSAKHQRLRKSFKLMFRQMKRHAAVFLTVSDFSRQRLAELQSIDPARIAVVGNGVEEEYFEPADADEMWHINKPNPYIIMVGGINERKGGDDVIRLAQLLLAKKSPLRIHVAGLHDSQMLDRALQLGNVTNLGFISDEQLLHATRGAALSMLLSRYEGFGIPALEAMAAGVPAIVSHHASLPEIAGDAGTIVNPEDPSAIVNTCYRLIEDAVYREGVIARGKINAERYRWADCVQRLHRVLTDRA